MHRNQKVLENPCTRESNPFTEKLTPKIRSGLPQNKATIFKEWRLIARFTAKVNFYHELKLQHFQIILRAHKIICVYLKMLMDNKIQKEEKLWFRSIQYGYFGQHAHFAGIKFCIQSDLKVSRGLNFEVSQRKLYFTPKCESDHLIKSYFLIYLEKILHLLP